MERHRTPTAQRWRFADRSRCSGAVTGSERDPVPVVAAERAWSVLGQSVAVPLAVCSAHERGDDLEVPLRDVARLTPEVGKANVDVQLEELDAGGSLSHAEKGSKGVGRRSDNDEFWGFRRSLVETAN